MNRRRLLQLAASAPLAATLPAVTVLGAIDPARSATDMAGLVSFTFNTGPQHLLRFVNIRNALTTDMAAWVTDWTAPEASDPA